MINQQTLELYIYVDGVNDIPFFSNSYEQFITSNGETFVTSNGDTFNVRALNEDIVIHAFTYNAQRMGAAPTITATIKYNRCLDELFSEKVYAEFNGEKYFLSATPSSSYSKDEAMYKHDATFVSERIALENTYFYDVVTNDTTIDRPVSNNSDFVFYGDIKQFVSRLNSSLIKSGLEYKVEIDDGIETEEKLVDIENKFFLEVLQEIYTTFDLPYYFVGKTIHVGYSANAISRVFKYGDSDALVSISKTNTNRRTINRVTGMGSEENIPSYYPNNCPVGYISVKADRNNRGITQNNLSLYHPMKLYNHKDINEFEYIRSKVSGGRPFDFYGFIEYPYGKGSKSTSLDFNYFEKLFEFTNENEGTFTLRYVFSNFEKTKFNDDLSYEPWEMLEYPAFPGVLWHKVKNVGLLHFIPTLSVLTSSSVDAKNNFKIKGVKVSWIDESVYSDTMYHEVHVGTDEYGNDMWEEWTVEHLITHVKSSYEITPDKHGYYYFPDFANAMYVPYETEDGDPISLAYGIQEEEGYGISSICVEWEIEAPKAKYTLQFNNGIYADDELVWGSNGELVDFDDFGIRVNGTPVEGDKIYKHIDRDNTIIQQNKLMPPIYRETIGAERYYNAKNGEYFIPNEDGVDSELTYTFENEYNGYNPKEQIVQFEDIKPTIKGGKNNEGLRIDMFSEFAYDKDDNNNTIETDEGKVIYDHPFFYGKLRKLGFNLFDRAIDGKDMTISMATGHCGGCNFRIAVDDSDKKTNLVQVDENGNLKYDENGRVVCGAKENGQKEVIGMPRQQDTTDNEVWIALYKDKDTYGTLMPRIQNSIDEDGNEIRSDLRPLACSSTNENDGDTFVIVNIDLPQYYIELAEKELERQLIYFMYDNNSEKFSFSIKFSRIFFAENEAILKLLDENSRITVEYDGREYTLYVSSITYKATENDILPEITVELKDELSVNKNMVQKAVAQAKEDLYRMLNGIDVIAQGNGVFLRKDQPDVALQPITFEEQITLNKGARINNSIESKDYFEGLKGLGISKNEKGEWHIEADHIHARKKFTANEVEIQKVYHIGGAQIKSAASIVCSHVEETEDGYICRFKQRNEDGESIRNMFRVNDLAYVKTFNLVENKDNDITNHFYWRLVTETGYDYIKLSKIDCADGSTVPMAGDHIVQLGNRTDESRQVAVIDAGAGEGAPYYRQYVGINSFELPVPETQLKPNDNVLTGKVVMQSGSTGLENFGEWAGKQKEIDDAMQQAKNAEASAKSYADELIKGLQDQLDGKVESFFYPYDPSFDLEPTSEWTTREEMEAHINDTFTNIHTGQSWRWVYLDGDYQWMSIDDTQALEALSKAQEALALANNKVAVFVGNEIPRSPYNKNDLWLQGEGGRIMRCTTTRTTNDESYYSDWVNADDYKDYIETLIGQVKDESSHTWYSNEYTTQSLPTVADGVKLGDTFIPYDATHQMYVYTDRGWILCGDNTKTVVNGGLITTGTIQLGDSSVGAKAGITGAGAADSSVRIWAGSGKNSMSNAPFRVTADGTMYASRGMFNGEINVSNGVFKVGKDGSLVASKARIQGSLIRPFTNWASEGTPKETDHFYDFTNQTHVLPCDIEQSGRKITLVGSMKLGLGLATARFFENGNETTELHLSNESVELLAFTETYPNDIFHGWIVVNRTKFYNGVKNPYGSISHNLAHGTIKYITANNIKTNIKTFDGSDIKATNAGGNYPAVHITLPKEWKIESPDEIICIATVVVYPNYWAFTVRTNKYQQADGSVAITFQWFDPEGVAGYGVCDFIISRI